MGRIDREAPGLKEKLTHAVGWTPLVGAYASRLYSQSAQRDLYSYQKAGYERQLADWERNVGKGVRRIQYPELSYPGRIRALDTGISQSYADSFGAISRFTGTAIGLGYRGASKRSRSLYGQLGGRSSRFL